jgi:hypothetical protein
MITRSRTVQERPGVGPAVDVGGGPCQTSGLPAPGPGTGGVSGRPVRPLSPGLFDEVDLIRHRDGLDGNAWPSEEVGHVGSRRQSGGQRPQSSAPVKAGTSGRAPVGLHERASDNPSEGECHDEHSRQPGSFSEPRSWACFEGFYGPPDAT